MADSTVVAMPATVEAMKVRAVVPPICAPRLHLPIELRLPLAAVAPVVMPEASAEMPAVSPVVVEPAGRESVVLVQLKAPAETEARVTEVPPELAVL